MQIGEPHSLGGGILPSSDPLGGSPMDHLHSASGGIRGPSMPPLAPPTSATAGSRSRLLRSSLASKMTQHMHSAGAGDALLDLCASLPLLSAYIGSWSEAASGEAETCIPATQAEALAHRDTFLDLVRFFFSFKTCLSVVKSEVHF